MEVLPVTPRPIVNGLSVDVEDWFQVGAFENVIARDAWDTLPLRVSDNVLRVLDLFAEAEVKGAKLPIQALVDQVTSWFVPAVIGIATVTFGVWLIFSLGRSTPVRLSYSNVSTILIRPSIFIFSARW